MEPGWDLDASKGGVEAHKIETWRVFRPTVADSHHFEKEAWSGTGSKVRSRIRDTEKYFQCWNCCSESLRLKYKGFFCSIKVCVGTFSIKMFWRLKSALCNVYILRGIVYLIILFADGVSYIQPPQREPPPPPSYPILFVKGQKEKRKFVISEPNWRLQTNLCLLWLLTVHDIVSSK